MTSIGTRIRHDDTGITGTVTATPADDGYLTWRTDDGRSLVSHICDVTAIDGLRSITASFYELHARVAR